jgi:hypothetical protein
MTFITAGSVFAAMKATVRKYESSDEEAVVGLSLPAWEPVFDAVEEILDGSSSFGSAETGAPARPRKCALCSPLPDKQVWVTEGAIAGFSHPGCESP